MNGLLSEEELIASGLLSPSKAGMTHYPSQYPNPVRFPDLYNMGADAFNRVMELGPEMRNAFPFPDYRNMPQQPMNPETQDMVAAAAVDMANPSAGVLAKLPGLLGIIAGKKAKTADLGLLAQAEELKAAGFPADEIYSKTKWWLDHPDGQPRFEIDDSHLRLGGYETTMHNNFGEYEGLKFISKAKNELPHNELYRNYPEMADIQVSGHVDPGGFSRKNYMSGSYTPRYVNFRGEITPDKIRMVSDTKEGAKSTGIHELQHGVQNREKFAVGGSPDQFSQLQSKQMSPEDQYRRLAGEAEARLVQHRMNLTPEQRMQYPFYQPYEVYGYDVPLEDQIVRFDK